MSKRILVVEDHADSREMLTHLLTFAGYSVVTAEDGYDALNKAKAEPPHLILTDMRMPNLSGVELVEQLRQIPEFSKTPVIFLTADVDGKSEAMQAGASCVLLKPFSLETLTDTIKRLLEASLLLIAAIGLR